MPLLRFDDISLELGETLILRDAEMTIEAGERVCLIGRNGAGKSTTFRLITGEIEPDRGEITARQDLIVSQLEQNLPEAKELPVTDVIRRSRHYSKSTSAARNSNSTSTACAISKHCTRGSTPTTAGISTSASRRPSPTSSYPPTSR
jgi:ATPase subunit of ABC transporter with duplicated ATPase domains